MPVKGRKGKAAGKSLLLTPVEEDEVDEPIVAPGGEAPAVSLLAQAPEEEHDEPLLVEKSSEDTNSAMVVDEKISVDAPVLDLRKAGDAGAIADSQNCSAECAEAMSAIVADCWDISSWIIFYEEVEQGRGGDITLVDAFERIVAQFPRSARFWKNLAEHFLHKGDIERAEATFRKCLYKCRSVDLWRSFLNFQTTAFGDSLRMGLQTEQYLAAQSKCDACFKDAIDNVGLALNAFPIWRSYIDFVKNWPESGVLESGKKLRTLRELYQRAVCVAMEQADDLWAEYEAFEKTHGDPTTVEALLPEVNRKFLHAKSIMRERKRFMANIVFDRLATPPTAAPSELQQLEQWAHWIRYVSCLPLRCGLPSDLHLCTAYTKWK
jgi:tetratricopeptide (TPR) repeat protein